MLKFLGKNEVVVYPGCKCQDCPSYDRCTSSSRHWDIMDSFVTVLIPLIIILLSLYCFIF